MSVTVSVKDKGAEKLLRNLLSKGAVSVGILQGDAEQPHRGSIKAAERKELRMLNSAHRKLEKGALRLTKRGASGPLRQLTYKQQARRRQLGRKAKDLELTIGEIAAIHEFGLGNVPQRSFLAGWADENGPKINTVIVRGTRAVVSGKLTPIQFLNQFGAWAAGDVQRRMSNNIPPPLSPITIQRKGSSVALIDTGQLRSSVTFRVDAVQLAKGVFHIR